MKEFDIFNLNIADVDTHEVKSKSATSDIYKPSADEGKDGVYKALIRFVPNPTNPRNSLIKKYVQPIQLICIFHLIRVYYLYGHV